MKRLSEGILFIIALVCQALNAASVTGRYINCQNFQRICFHLMGGAMAAATTTTIQILQATDKDGTGSKDVTGASAIVTANVLARKVTVALAAVGLADLVVVNDITYTQAAATSVADREFVDAAGLVLCINDPVYGVVGIEALAAGTNVALYPDDPAGEDETYLTVTSTNAGGTVTVATNEAHAFIDLDVSGLDLANDFTHIAAKVTTTANSTISVAGMGYVPRYRMPSRVAASATL